MNGTFRKSYCTLLLFLACLLVLTACLPALPPEQYVYVLHVGVERGDELPYCVVLLVTQAKPGTGEESASKLQVLSAEARSLPEAVVVFSAGMPYQLNFSRVSLLVLSRELAESGEVLDVMDISFAKLNLSPHINMSVTESSMVELFEGMLSESDPGLSKLTLNRRYHYERMGMTVNNSLTGLMESRQSRAFDMIYTLSNLDPNGARRDMVGGEVYPYLAGALPAESVNKSADMGTAVFSGEKMVGTLSGQHTMLVLIGTGNFKSGRLLMPFGDDWAAIALRPLGSPKIWLEGESASLSVRLEAELEKPSLMERCSQGELERLIGEHVAIEMAHVFEAVQAADSDVFGFGKTAIRQCGAIGEWQSGAWRQTYQKLHVSFLVEIRLKTETEN